MFLTGVCPTIFSCFLFLHFAKLIMSVGIPLTGVTTLLHAALDGEKLQPSGWRAVNNVDRVSIK
jgi:hypothetical protein